MCGGGGEGGGGGGGGKGGGGGCTGGRAGAAIEHYFLFSSFLSGEYGSMWGGCEEGMRAVGVVGTFVWVVNAVKAQNQAEQEGAPPDADPGGSADMSWDVSRGPG